MKKLQKIVFILLLIFLPSQFGLHFWPSWAYVNGIRVDYFSPTFYFTDILVVLLFIVSLRGTNAVSDAAIFLRRKKIASALWLLAMTIFVFLNVYFSLSPFVSIYKWLKVAEFGFLAWFIAKNSHHSIKLEHVTVMLLIPIVYESVLALWQYLIQSSIGGLWYFLGERTFNSSTPGIANAFINGSLVMRPYGTFPHPNVLGGFMLVSVLIILCYFPHISRRITAAVLVLGTAGLFLSLSRTAILAGVVSSIFVVKKRFLVLLTLLALLFLLPRFTSLLVETEPLVAREQLNNLAIEKWKQSPLFGTGLGTAPIYTSNVKNYALAHQPTHNIYLLILAETGIMGFVLCGLLIIKTLKHLLQIANWKLLIVISVILVLGLFDHYFLTIQQGQLLLAMVIGLASYDTIFAYGNNKRKFKSQKYFRS